MHFRSSLVLIGLFGLILSNPGFGWPLVAAPAAQAAGPATLVKDITTEQNREWFGSMPGSFLTIGAITYFTAQLDSTGMELWKTDRTANGTQLLKDILPGRSNSVIGALTDFNGTLFFTAGQSGGPYGLWKSNGTTNGTVLVKAINPGVGGSSITGLQVFNGTLYFLATSLVNGNTYDLWKSDGSANGTVLVKQVGATPPILVAANGLLYMTAGDASTGLELWKSDGSTSGTVLVKDIVPGANGSYPTHLTAVGPTLYFVTDNDKSLWKSNGSAAGTVLVDLPPGIRNPTELVDLNGALVFSAMRMLEFSSVQGIWKSDGTTANTVLLQEIDPGYSTAPATYHFQSLNGMLYFIAVDGAHGTELWKSDGTSTGTALLKDICPGPNGGGAAGLTNVNGAIFFGASDCSSGYGQLWKTNGTTNSTLLVKVIGISALAGVGEMANANGTLVFAGDDSTTGLELWKSNGSANGTVLVKDIDPDAGNSFDREAPSFISVGASVFFSNNSYSGDQPTLWKTDGTANGTVLLKSFAGSNMNRAPYDLTNVNGTVFFIGQDDATGRELWKSNGTPAGTVLVKNIYPIEYLTSPIDILGSQNGQVFFMAEDGANGAELWKSDGTANGTLMVKDINPGSGSSVPYNMVNLNGTLFFTADDGVHGDELWKSDGTANGTMLVKDIRPGPQGSVDSAELALTAMNGTVFFAANDGVHGDEPWKTDGTANGTVLLKDINPGVSSAFYPYSSQALPMPALNGQLFFSANDGVHGDELWKTDGSTGGTLILKDAVAGAAGQNPGVPVSLGNTLIFTAGSGTASVELWKTDGTANGTVRYKAPEVGTFQYMAGPFTPLGANGKAAFAAADGTYGWELWQTDGTANGTTLLHDIAAGPASSNAWHFFTAGERMYFTADDITHGQELWSLDLSALPPAAPSLELTGPASVVVGAGARFIASVAPASTAAPVSYTWQTSGQSTVTHTGGLSDTVTFTWGAAGTQTITVTASNAGGLLGSDTITVTSTAKPDLTPESGGSMSWPNLSITFPPGAVSEPLMLEYTPLAAPTHALDGATLVRGFTLAARTLGGQPVAQFQKPYTLVLNYTDTELAGLGLAEDQLKLAFWNGSDWVELLPCAGCGVDMLNNRVTVLLDHFTEFALTSRAGSGTQQERKYYMPIARR